MGKWLLPVTVIGLSGIGLIFASERGRKSISTLFDRLAESGAPMDEIDRLWEDQLSAIQNSLNVLAEVLKESEA